MDNRPLILLASGSLASCSSEALEEVQAPKVLEAFASKSQLLSRSPEEQKQAWIARLDLYLQMDLSQAQKGLIREMQADMRELEKGKFFLSDNLRQNALAMARITPREDFLNLFVEITGALPNLVKSGSPCDICITDLENYALPIQEDEEALSFRADDCDCSWTCSQQEDDMVCEEGVATTLSPCQGGQTTNCCNKTLSNCGFLLQNSCTGLVVCQE